MTIKIVKMMIIMVTMIIIITITVVVVRIISMTKIMIIIAGNYIHDINSNDNNINSDYNDNCYH